MTDTINIPRAELQAALDAIDEYYATTPEGKALIETLRAALAQGEQEPVAWGFQNTGITGSNRWMYLRETIPAEDQYRGVLWTPLYTAPPQRPWQGLTEQDTLQIRAEWEVRDYRLSELCRAIEAKLKEKNK